MQVDLSQKSKKLFLLERGQDKGYLKQEMDRGHPLNHSLTIIQVLLRIQQKKCQPHELEAESVKTAAESKTAIENFAAISDQSTIASVLHPSNLRSVLVQRIESLQRND